jgi:hypothetical protein
MDVISFFIALSLRRPESMAHLSAPVANGRASRTPPGDLPLAVPNAGCFDSITENTAEIQPVFSKISARSGDSARSAAFLLTGTPAVMPEDGFI